MAKIRDYLITYFDKVSDLTAKQITLTMQRLRNSCHFCYDTLLRSNSQLVALTYTSEKIYKHNIHIYITLNNVIKYRCYM